MNDSVARQKWPNVYAGVERQRRGQKVARGKREARRPWISNNNNSGPTGRQKTAARASVAPPGLSRFLGMIQGLRARCARPCPWLPSGRAFGAHAVSLDQHIGRAFGAHAVSLDQHIGRLRRSRYVHDEAQNS